jgi:hypothetical protein
MRVLEDGVWQADLSFARSNGEALGDRRLLSQASSCAALKDPVSLVIALMVEARETETTMRLPAPSSSTQHGATMATSFSLSSGLLPNVGFGATIDVGWNLGRWLPLHVDSTFWFPNAAVLAGQGGEFWAWAAGAGACPTLVTAANIAGTVCVGAQAGVIHGTGVGLQHTGSPTKPYGDAEARARVSFPRSGPLGVFVQLGVAVPFLRPRFVYLDASSAPVEVYRPQAMILFGGIGMELRAGLETQSSAISQ